MTSQAGRVEWIEIWPGVTIVANAERAWLHRIDPFDSADPFAAEMTGAGSLETTRQLLDGAIGFAQRAISRYDRRPALSEARWVWRLAGFYHTTNATPRLMAEAAARFRAAGRRDLAEYAEEKVRDEAGHDELALRDLRALGYDAEALVAELIPPTAADLVAWFTHCVRGVHPIDCLGYAYALERLAVTNSREYIEQVERVLPSGVRATRCLRVHSATSADARHVEDALNTIAALPAADRRRVARACHQTALIACAPPPEGNLLETTLRQRVTAFKLRSITVTV